VPLCPSHVAELVKSGVKVVVEPSKSRIFPDVDYAKVGAQLSNDLSPCDVILGVKQPDQSKLLAKKTYMFFSHVIKGQTENKQLLDKVLDLNISLFDYECIKQPSVQKKAPRLVAFGKFAGIAGMINTFQGLGQKLLSHGISTPFLACPPSHMHTDLAAAKRTIKHMGHRIVKGGLDALDLPLVFVFTGTGNVSKGAQEIFRLLPHKMVDVAELPALWQQKGPHKQLYGCVATDADMVKLVDPSTRTGAFNVSHYREQPHEYASTFHETVAPYTSVLVNGIYWDQRYPRLLTKAQLQDLHAGREEDVRRPVLMVSDISCDVNGSVEFLERSTSIDRPYFDYDPTQGVRDQIQRSGVTMMGVDILPSELPMEASSFFGDRLLPVVKELLAHQGTTFKPSAELKKIGIEISDAPPGLEGLPSYLFDACIAAGGALCPSYEYIAGLMQQRLREGGEGPSQVGAEIRLHGHLFDSGLINKVLDCIESNGGHFSIVECLVQPHSKTSAIIRIDAQGDQAVLDTIVGKIQLLVQALESAEASIVVVGQGGMNAGAKLHGGAGGGSVRVQSGAGQRVVVLGAGRVAASLVEFLGREEGRTVVVASAIKAEADACAALARSGSGRQLDVHGQHGELEALVGGADVVVSLLPAGMHVPVAEECVRQRTHLVTASYVSDGMRGLHDRARTAGCTLMNEVGLDPGMDHMSAMSIIDEVRERGGRIVHFASLCGGLPAPEAADNALRYKFSWSPRGVLAASHNNARWRWEGEERAVDGRELLGAASDTEAFSELGLEVVPNRDSLAYESVYGIEGAPTVFRGTLRYRGFSRVMRALQVAGLTRDVPAGDGVVTWGRVARDEKLVVALRKELAQCEELLGLTGDSPMSNPSSILDSLCHRMEERLKFEDGERDMVVMHHDIRALMPDGDIEAFSSSLKLFGDDRMTAMCRTVGVTTAICTQLLLQGPAPGEKEIPTGVVTPVCKELYAPALRMLAEEGLVFEESKTIIAGANKAAKDKAVS